MADFDLIFANILVDGDHWTLIDYEWTFDRPIETRALPSGLYTVMYWKMKDVMHWNWIVFWIVWASRKTKPDSTESRRWNFRNM